MTARLQHLPTRAWIAGGVAIAVAFLGFAVSDVGAQDETVEIHKLAHAEHWGYGDTPVFVAIVGTDDRPSDPRWGQGASGARADAIHVVGINPGQFKGTIINIPRDTYIDIPGQGTRKINEAHSRGQAELMGETLRQFTGANIQFVVTTNFEGFVNIVDDSEGVLVELPTAISDSASGASFPAGPVQMSGLAALALARARKGVARGDFTRTHNQALLLLAALEKVQSVAPTPADFARHVATLMRNLKTTSGVTPADLYQLSRLAVTVSTDNILNITMPGSTGSAGGASVVFPAPEAQALFADFADDAIVQAPPAQDGAGNTFG